MLPAYPRAEIERRICERIEKGWTLARLAGEPGFPTRQTVHRWAAADPSFAARLREARLWRTGMRGEFRSAPSFNESQAEAFLLAVRRGTAVRDLVKRPEWPNRDRLNRWKRERPEFAAALAASVRFSRQVARRGWIAFDQRLADRIIVKLAAGAPMPQVLADPALPSKPVVRRWKAQRPDFAAAVNAARAAGHRTRMRALSKRTPAIEDEILDRLARGDSLLGISRLAHMPHYVTLQTWMRADPGFAQMVGWARQDGQIALGDEACGIAEAAGEHGFEAARKRVAALRKRMGRMAPRRRAAR